MDNIYITENGYFYCYETGKMFKPSEELDILLRNTESQKELQAKYIDGIIPKELYQRLSMLLFSNQKVLNKVEASTQISKLQLIVTNSCNMRCKYCYAHSGTYDQTIKMMNYDTAKRAIDIFFEKFENIRYISFFGGEPLLNIRLIDKVCSYIRRKYRGRYEAFMMMSNLLNLSDEACAIIRRHKIHLTSSLDGDAICNDCNRIDMAGNGTYSRVADNIVKLREITMQPEAIEATLTKVCSDKGMTSLDLANYFYEKFGIICSSGVFAKVYDSNVEPYVMQKEPSLDEYIDAYIEKGLVTEYVKNFLLLIQGKQITGPFCDAGISQFNIMPNGDIYPCQMFAMIPGKKYCMGNVNEGGLDDSNFQKVQKELLGYSREKLKKCSNCKVRGNCSQCVADILYNQDEFIPQDKDCGAFFEETKKYIEYYSKLFSNKERWKRFTNRVTMDNKLWKRI